MVRGAKVNFAATLFPTEDGTYQYLWRDNGIPTQSNVSFVVVVIVTHRQII